jgi:hypothetical protein
MELQLSPTQQNSLLELYQSLANTSKEITIRMKPGVIKVENNLSKTTIIVPERFNKSIKRRNIQQYVEEAYNAEMEIDLSVYKETDLNKLLSFTIDSEKSNGQRILAFSKSWEILSKKLKQKETTSSQIQKDIWSQIKRNGIHFMRTAQKANQVMEVMGNSFPRKLEVITSTWLRHIKNSDFKEFLELTKARYREEIKFLAGARE